MREQWRTTALLLLVALSWASARVVPQPVLLSEQKRDDCTLESQRLFHCASYNAPNSMLTDKQKEMCCEAVQTFNLNGCFCGWGSAAAMNPWTRDVLSDLASALHSCNVGVIPCVAGEEYLQEGDALAVAYSGDEMEALQAASSAVSRMVTQDGWGVGSSRLPERLASSLQPLFDLNFLNRALPSYPQGEFAGDELAPGDFDIEVEVEQEGGDSEQLSATMAQLSRWMAALLGGDDALAAADSAAAIRPGPDRADTLGGVVSQVLQLLNAILNGTDAQVEVAVEITVETTTTTSSATRFSSRKDISGARPLISRVSTAPLSAGPGAAATGRMERMVAETAQQTTHGARPHCWMQRLAGTVTENPARAFAVLAGIAFVVLLATLIAQVAVALVCEVQRQMAPQEEEEVVNPLLAPELTTPLLNSRGELHNTYL